MQGFKDFLARGNLIELAVAFIMGTVFAGVVQAFTKIVLDVLGLVVRVEGLSDIAVRGVNVGNFITALITFVLTAAVLYFLVVLPYNRLNELRLRDEAAQDEPVKTATSEELLAEIRDLLRAQSNRS
jgi:large conductance mechanosensitive channel